MEPGGAEPVSSPPQPPVSWVAPPPVPTRGPTRFRSASTRATVLTIALGLNVVVSVIAAAIILSGKSALAAYEAGTGGIEALDAFDTAFGTLGLVEIVVFVATVVAWLAWQSRTVDNEDALGIGPSDITPRWSIGWWLIPFANLFMPYRAHREIQRRYARGAAVGGGLALAWWLAWIANNIGSTIAGRFWVAAETFDELQSALSMYLVSEALTILAAVLAIWLVRGIQRQADALAVAPPDVADPIFDPDTLPGPEATPAA